MLMERIISYARFVRDIVLMPFIVMMRGSIRMKKGVIRFRSVGNVSRSFRL